MKELNVQDAERVKGGAGALWGAADGAATGMSTGGKWGGAGGFGVLSQLVGLAVPTL